MDLSEAKGMMLNMKQYIKPILKLFGISALTYPIGVIIIALFVIARGIQALENPNVILAILIASQLIVLLIILFIYRKKHFTSMVRFEKTSPKILLWAFLTGLGLSHFSGLLLGIMNNLFPEQLDSYVEMLDSFGDAHISLILLGVLILAPLHEEIVMRGMLFHWFEKTNIKPWVLVVLSGLFFGIWHLNLVQGVFASVAGIFFALGFLLTKSLWVPIVMHFAFNFSGVIIICLPDTLNESQLFAILYYLIILLMPIGFFNIRKELMRHYSK